MSVRNFSSQSIRLGSRLLAASTAASGIFALSGCDNRKTESAIYHNAETCIEAQIFSPKFCQEHFAQAVKEHVLLAPQYDDKKDCEKDWRDNMCDPHTVTTQGGSYVYNGGSRTVYSPHMEGYWTGYTETPSDDPKIPPSRQFFSYPVYASQDGGVYSPETDQSFDGFGKIVSHPDFKTSEVVRSATRPIFSMGKSFSVGETGGSISRGGFGMTGRGFGFGVGE